MPLSISIEREYSAQTASFERVPPKNANKMMRLIYARYKKHADLFASTSCTKVNSTEHSLLYVTQREMAVVAHDDGWHVEREVVDTVGSEDATTCHILVLHDMNSGAVLLAHIDNADSMAQVNQAVKAMVERCDECERLDVYLVGGYEDGHGTSVQCSVDIVTALDAQEIELRLRLACISPLNDRVKKCGNHWPRVYGVCVRVGASQPFSVFPASFPNKGPELPLRSARHFGGNDDLLDIYDTEHRRLCIQPFKYTPISHCEAILHQSDAWILQHMSTSPLVEPPHFAGQVRAAVQFMLDTPNSALAFSDQSAHEYVMDSESEWVLLEE